MDEHVSSSQSTAHSSTQVIIIKNQKSPGVAAVLSFFFSGLGQIYNGEIMKGILFIVCGGISILLMWILIGFLLYPIVWIYGMYDAYKTAVKLNSSME